MNVSQSMNAQEKKAVSSLALIFAIRMLGLFLILPVFSVYAHGLEGAAEHPEWVGFALGAYGLTQALLQVPFGMMSDRFGRKPVIAAGLLLFAIGSVVAAMSDSLLGVMLGRIIQGSGAVAAAIIALSADLTRDEHRTKAMASIGITIGASFAVSMAIGPLLGVWIGVDGIFWLTGCLSLLAILVLYIVVPTPATHVHHMDSILSVAMLSKVLQHKHLLRLDVGVLIFHASLTAVFVVLPLLLLKPDHVLLLAESQWKLYLPVMLASFVLMVPFVIVAEAKRKMKAVFLTAIVLLLSSMLLLVFLPMGLWTITLFLLVFFIGFNVLEATMPSLVSKYAHPAAKGTAVGVFNTFQFLGAFVGGVLGGLVYAYSGQISMVFLSVAGLLLLWLLLAFGMQTPPHVATRLVPVMATEASSLRASLQALEGVFEVYFNAEEKVLYCKVDQKQVDEDRWQQTIDAVSKV